MKDDAKEGRSRDSRGRLLPGHSQGRPKGAKNKTTELLATFMDVYRTLNPDGRCEHLYQFAKDDPKTFYTLCSKLFPTRHELSGPDGGPIEARDCTLWTEEELLSILGEPPSSE